MKRSRLLMLLAGLLILTANVWAQSPSPSPSPRPLTAEERAEREKRLAERRAERRANDAKRATERKAKEAKRVEERKLRSAKEISERQARTARRAEEQKTRTAKQTAERQEMAAKRAAERQANNAKRQAARTAALAKRAEEARASHGTFRFLSSRMNAEFARVVKGAPYSAVAVTEFVQKFVDGNQIVGRNEVAYYRDSEGRTRVEQKLNTIGKWAAAGDAPRIIMIGDPVSGEYYDLDPRTLTAVKNVSLGKRLQEQKLRQERDPQSEKNKFELKRTDNSPTVSADGRKRTEILGSQRIEGVEAQGKRTVTTIPAGEIGNTLPIEITEESWYSPELKTVVMTKRHDPRSGDTTYRLTNINRRDPERSLFQVPGDYKVIEKSSLRRAPAKPKTEEKKPSTSQIFE